jgi:hypothetical protein
MVGPFGALFLEFPKADLPLGIVAEIVPTVHVVNVPAATLLVMYTDGVTDCRRNPIQGESQLRDAVMFAYQVSHLLSAEVVERQMFLTGSNLDDAAILTAWTPGIPIKRGQKTRAVRHNPSLACEEVVQGIAFGEYWTRRRWIS